MVRVSKSYNQVFPDQQHIDDIDDLAQRLGFPEFQDLSPLFGICSIGRYPRSESDF